MEPALSERIPTAGFGALVLTAGLLTFGQMATAPKAHAADPTGPITGYQGLCLDDRSASTADFNPVQVYTCNGSSAQSWTVGSAGNTLQVLGKCLDVNAAGTANGTTVDLYDLQRLRRPGLGPAVQRRAAEPQLRQVPGRHRLRRLRHPGPDLGLRRQLQPAVDAPTGGGGGGGGGSRTRTSART